MVNDPSQSIESACPECGRTLRVARQQAGSPVRCPSCNTIFTVGAARPDVPEGAEAAARGPREWRMRTPEGQNYGPVAKEELDRWVAEGRVTADCQLVCGSSGSWQSADTVYPVLRSEEPMLVTGSGPADAAGRTGYGHPAPHRGVLILVLGILSWAFTCPVIGIVAWVLGSSDLREMRAGRMDPSGMGLTQAGQIIGMIHAILLIAALVLGVFFVIAGVAVGFFG